MDADSVSDIPSTQPNKGGRPKLPPLAMDEPLYDASPHPAQVTVKAAIDILLSVQAKHKVNRTQC
jgi:hypothetical protein